MDALLRLLVRSGFRRGLGGGHWAWLVLGASAWMLRRARRPAEAEVLSKKVQPGERLLITLRTSGEAPRSCPAEVPASPPAPG